MKKMNWKELPIGAIITEPGSSMKFKTGDWRSEVPILDKEKCINCFFCFMYCPDSCIIIEDEKVKGINLDYCKGCGICAKECPKNAIEMKIVERRV